MKVTLFVRATPNGMIAKDNGDLSFVTDTEWQGLMKKAYDVGNCIFGSKAWEILSKRGKAPFNCLNIVMTKRKRSSDKPNVIFTGKKPKEVLKMLEEKGFQEALVIGGGHINASFVKQKLVEELVLDIEPSIFVKGVHIFEGKEIAARLKLIEARQVSPEEARLVYKVEK